MQIVDFVCCCFVNFDCMSIKRTNVGIDRIICGLSTVRYMFEHRSLHKCPVFTLNRIVV